MSPPKKRPGWVQRKIDKHRAAVSSCERAERDATSASAGFLRESYKGRADYEAEASSQMRELRQWHQKKLRFWQGVQRRWEAIKNWRRRGELQT